MLNNRSGRIAQLFLLAASACLILLYVGPNHLGRGSFSLLPESVRQTILKRRLKPQDRRRSSKLASKLSDTSVAREDLHQVGRASHPARHTDRGVAGYFRFRRLRCPQYQGQIKKARPVLLAAGGSLLLLGWLPNQLYGKGHASHAKFADHLTVRLHLRWAETTANVRPVRSGRRKGRFRPALNALGGLTSNLFARPSPHFVQRRYWQGPGQLARHRSLASQRHISEAILAALFLPLASLEESEQSLILHPYLFALFPALSLVSDNVELLSIDNAVLTIATITFVATHFSLRLLALVVRDSQKAGLLVSFALLLFFSYGHVYDFLITHLGRRGLRHRHALLAWTLLAIGAVRFSLREHAGSPAQTYFLNSVSGCLIALSLLQIARHQMTAPGKWQPTRQFPSKRLDIQGAGDLPDIYYIILDAHASPSALSEIYGYDIGALLERLKDRGFYIAERSCSNYAMTMLSLASSLNLDYLDSLSKSVGLAEKGLGLSKQLIENSVAMRFLMAAGYRAIFMGSGFGITQGNRYADVEISCGYMDETVGRLVHSTLLRAIADRTNLIANDKRKRIRCMFAELGKVHRLQSPKFVFAHIPSPQWPFLFDANGSPTNRLNLDTERKKEAYLDQLIFIDGEVEKLIDQILAGSAVAPIIVLQSDHGPNFAFPGGYDLQNPSLEVVQEKMRIFNAIYLPNGESDFLHQSISPVNTFRLIFNRYFGTDLPLLDDQSYFSTLEFPYRLTNVTNLVQND